VIAPCPFKNISKEFLEEHKIDKVIYASKDGNPYWTEHYQAPIRENKMIFLKYDDS